MLEKIQELNLLQRIWQFIVGTKKPDMLTQVSVAIAFAVWLYFFSWHLISFLSLLLMDTVENSTQLEMAFARIGSKYQMLLPGSIITYLFIHALVQLIIAGFSLTGLILIWRQKKVGFIVYLISNSLVYVATFILLGMAYMWNESSLLDFVLLLLITLYFGAGYWLFYRQK